MTDTIDLIEAQKDLEAAGLRVGAAAYKANQAFKEAHEGADKRQDSQTVMKGALPLVAREIALWLESEGGKEGRGRRHTALQYLREFDADHMAYIGLSRTFQAITSGNALPRIAINIGKIIEVELEAIAIKTTDKKLHAKFQKMAKSRDEDANLTAHERLADRLEVTMNWDDPLKATIGGVVLSCVLKGASEIFRRTIGTGGQARQSVVEFTDEAIELMDKMTDDAAWMHPKYTPMVSPPNPWTSLGSGAYLTREVAKTVPLVRTRSGEQKRMLKAAAEEGSLGLIMEAASALGATRWGIDTRTAEMVVWCADNGHKPSKSFPLAKSETPKLPKKLKKEAWDSLDAGVRTAMSRSRKTVRDIRKGAAIDRTVLDGDIGMAGFLADHEAFYLPHNYDFRQRIYPVPAFNHQRPDHIKGMLNFADAVPLGEHGGKWLMIHLANCGDFGKVSKKPFADRIKWVKDNEAMILSCARLPEESYEFWSEADSPFLFLQACFDYAEWAESGFSTDHASRGIAAIDGSCSGLQHYSAMMRAEQEAYHVNLIPRDTVGDIYQVVADKARPTLVFMASPEWLAGRRNDLSTGLIKVSKAKTAEEIVSGFITDNKAANVILEQGFGRSEAKRPTMTYFYGSAKFGMRDQYMDDIMRPLTDKVALAKIDEKTGRAYEHGYALLSPKSGQLDGGFACAQVMALVVHEAIETVAPKAAEAAEWYQLVAGIAAHEGKSVVWTTPVGFPVVHRYSEYESKVVNMWLYDRDVAVLGLEKVTGMPQVDAQGRVSTRVTMVLRGAPTKRIDKHKARSAVAPNLVHSMDGAHMTRVIIMAVAAGILNMAMIHDSFGCHYGHMEQFAQIVRDAFVATYEEYCPFQAVLEGTGALLDDAGKAKLPPVPEKGALDLQVVKGAQFAFA